MSTNSDTMVRQCSGYGWRQAKKGKIGNKTCKNKLKEEKNTDTNLRLDD